MNCFVKYDNLNIYKKKTLTINKMTKKKPTSKPIRIIKQLNANLTEGKPGKRRSQTSIKKRRKHQLKKRRKTKQI
jgi:hypothetical protein